MRRRVRRHGGGEVLQLCERGRAGDRRGDRGARQLPGERHLADRRADASTDDVEGRHPGLKARLVDVKDSATALRRFVNVYVNDEDVRFTGALDTQVKDGDSVTILPAVAGG